MKDRSERVTLDEVRPSGILKRVDAVSQSFLVPVMSFGRHFGKRPAGDRLQVSDTASESDAHFGLIGGSSHLIPLPRRVQPASLPEVPDKLVECFRVPISNLPKSCAKALNMVPCPQ
jgi:hypothetical protein